MSCRLLNKIPPTANRQPPTIIFRFLILLVTSLHYQNRIHTQGWEVVNGNPTGNKFSSLHQIDTANVQQLKVAWTYHTGDVDTAAHSQIQCNPIIINGTLYGTSPQLKLFALDAATGKEIWITIHSTACPDGKNINFNLNSNRGVAYWTDGAGR